jgi:uncharacterized repeat protein (TIGR02543 family)
LAVFESVDLSGDSNIYETTTASTTTQSKRLTVSTDFTKNTGGKSVAITLVDGFTFQSAPGMVGAPTAAGTWAFDATLLEGTFLNGFVTGATWTPTAPIALSSGSYRPLSGTLTYTVSAGAEDLGLSIRVKGDIPFLFNGSTRDFNNAITVEAFQNDALWESAVLETYRMTGVTSLTCFAGNSSNELVRYVAAGDSWSNSINFIVYGTGLLDPGPAYLFDNWVWTIKMKKGAGMKSVSSSQFNIVSQSLDTTSDTEYDFLTLNIKPTSSSLSLGRPHFVISGILAPLDPIGTIYNVTSVSSDVTLPDNTHNTVISDYSPGQVVCVARADQLFKMLSIQKYDLHKDEADSPAAMIKLGGFNMKNENAVAISGRRMRLDFPSSRIGVQSVKTWTGPEGARNIVVYTTAGRTLTPTDLRGESSPFLNLYSVLNQDEFISWVEWDMGTIPSSSQSSTSLLNRAPHWSSLNFGGKLLDGTVSSSAYKAVATVLHWDEDEEVWVANETKTEIFAVTNTAAKQADYRVGTTGSGTVAAGTTRAISAYFSSEEYRYGSAASMYAYKGFEVFVREPKGLHIDPASLKATYNGVEYKSYSIITANDGTKVYRIELPEAIFGFQNTNGWGYPNIEVSANLFIPVSTPASTVRMRDIFMGKPTDPAVTKANSYGGANSISNDPFLVTGVATNGLGVPPSTTYLTITPAPDFSVGLSADKSDDSWQQYINGDASTVIDLNTQLSARLRLQVSNGTGKEIDNGFSVIIPIPKKGETVTTDPPIMSGNFGWSASLTDEANTELTKADYEIKYATSYLTGIDDSGWEDWATVSSAPTSIKAVKISYVGTAPIDFTDTLTFSLDVPVPANPTEANALQGALNIWSANVYLNVPGTLVGYKASEPVALCMNTGLVSGTVYRDIDRSGTINPAASSGPDTGWFGVTVQAYKAGSRNSVDLMEETTTDVNGFYEFITLSNTQDVDIVFTVPSGSRLIIPTPSNSINGVTPSADDNSHLGNNALLQEPYSVTFNARGGSPIPTTQYVYIDEKATKPATPTLNGYTYSGTWTKGSVTGTVWSFVDNGVVEDMTLYAVRSAIPYDITYDLDDGKFAGGDTHPEQYNIETPNINVSNPTKTGYSFSGWTSEGGITIDDITKPVNIPLGTTGDIDFTAHWTANPYTLTYNLNDGGDVTTDRNSGAATDSLDFDTLLNSAAHYTNNPLDAKAPTRTGYTFDGWYLEDTGTTPIGGATMPEDGIEVFAKWVIDKYTVNFEVDGTGGSLSGQDEYADVPHGTLWDSAIAAVPTPVPNEGYELAGTWTPAFPSAVTASATYKVRFTSKLYTVNYDTDGAGTIAPKLNVKWADGGLLPAKNPAKIGYDFVRWDVSVGGNADPQTDVKAAYTYSYLASSDAISAITLKAVWKIKEYTITFVADEGGTLSGKTSYITIPHGTTWKDAGILLPTTVPKNEHYSFDVWNSSIPSEDSAITGNATYTASFKLDSHTVTYFGNGHTSGVEPSAVTLVHGKQATVNGANTLAKEGYTFLGWAESADSTVVSHAEGKAITLTKDITLYAVWQEDEVIAPPIVAFTYAVSYLPGGSNVSGLPNGASGLEEGVLYNVANGVPKREGFTFAGWSYDGGTVKGGDSFRIPSKNVVLTALWESVATPSVVQKTEKPEVAALSEPQEPTASLTQAEVADAASNAGIPILPGGIPLVAPLGFDTWSLLDLILTVLAVVWAVVTIVSGARRRNDEENEQRDFEENEQRTKTRLGFLLLSGIIAVVAAVLFVITQDMSLPMVLLDGWTIVFAILFVGSVIAAKLSRKKVKEEEAESEFTVA